MKKQWTRISLGLILILAGVGYAGSVLDAVSHRPLSVFHPG